MTLEQSLYKTLNDTPAGTAFEEMLTVGDLVEVLALEHCADAIAQNPNEEDSIEFVRELGLQQNVFESACERVADVLNDYDSPEEPQGGMERGETAERQSDIQRNLK